MRSPGEALLETQVKTLILPIALLSKNSRDKLHFRRRSELRNEYKAIIDIKYRHRDPAPQFKQKVIVTRIKGPRERDFDHQNIGAGSAIELIDALTALRYWVDDTPRWLETEFKQTSRALIRGPAVLIEIEVLP